MPIARPFRAIRPAKNLVHLIVSRSYISYDDESLSHKLANNPYSFIHIINPDHGSDDAAPSGSQALFQRVRDKYMEFYQENYFVQDEKPGYYIYRQRFGELDFYGVICATASKDYAEGKIKRHELTITRREKMFTEYLHTTGINAEPVLLSYPDSESVDEVIERRMEKKPIYDFYTHDRMRHTLWAIDKPKDIAKVESAFAEVNAFYIADGHHRIASSARLTVEENDGDYGLEAPHDYFMSYLVPSSQMHIEAFHRLIKLDGQVDKEQILQSLSNEFLVEELSEARDPSKKGELCLNIKGDWYRLEAKAPDEHMLDVRLCSESILEPIFGVKDLQTDDRISFVNGLRGIEPLNEAINRGKADVAIALYPIQMDEIFEVSDRGETMPPKSTWVEPKLRSAMTIYSLTDH